MNTSDLARQLQIDALGGDLRPSETTPRPIPQPRKRSSSTIRGRR